MDAVSIGRDHGAHRLSWALEILQDPDRERHMTTRWKDAILRGLHGTLEYVRRGTSTWRTIPDKNRRQLQ
ncbi:hypothetical protein NDU88_001749 [Pleurodeles waltl]|uniref:Transposase n=1 Tax=Pleurodeles waltl TaxID=8319 RepID=A0AAV7U7Q2_PLEWA|nr:hypothetical protein NDU88_001749 [Pleurodeles waltl]